MSLDRLRLEGDDLQEYLKMQKGFMCIRIHDAIQQFQQDAALHGADPIETLECVIDATYVVLTAEEKSLETIKKFMEKPCDS